MNTWNKYFFRLSKISLNADAPFLNKISLTKLKQIIPSKRLFFALLILGGIIKSNSNKESLQIDEINFNEEIYKEKKDKKLFKNSKRRIETFFLNAF